MTKANKQAVANLEKFSKKLDIELAKVGKLRDELRDILDEYQMVLDDLDEGYSYVAEAINNVNDAVQTLSNRV